MKYGSKTSKISFVYGGTGSGKTRKIIEIAEGVLKGTIDGDNKILVIAVPSKSSANRIFQDLKQYARDSRHLCFYVSGSTYSSKTLIVQSKIDKKFKSPKVIVTTHAYLKKRGISFYIYSFHLDLLWLKNILNKEIHLYLDEAHLYLDSLTWSLKTQGIYYDSMELGGDSIKKVVPSIRNIKKSDHSLFSNYYLSNTRHVFVIDKYSRNPEIKWDIGLSPGQQHYTFPTLKGKKNEVEFLSTKYSYIRSLTWDIQKMNSLCYFYALPRISKEHRSYLVDACNHLGVKIRSFQEYYYENVVRELLSTTPYLIETSITDDAEYDETYHRRFISGYDFLSLFLLDQIFDKIELLSASFSSHHYLLFDYLNIDFTIEELVVDKGILKDDYGCVIFNEKKASVKMLNMLSETGNLIHFCYNKEESEKLSAKLSENEQTRYNFAFYETVFKEEFKLRTISKDPISSHMKKISLSYWGSNLSTGVNLPKLDICSVDLKHAIPFLFIPMDRINTADHLRAYIDNYIVESVIQMISRICRRKGDRFKVIILNRAFESNEKIGRNIRELIIGNSQFNDKFKLFKIYKGVKFKEATVNLLKRFFSENSIIKDSKTLLDSVEEINNEEKKYAKLLDQGGNIGGVPDTVEKKWTDVFNECTLYTVKSSKDDWGVYISFLNIQNLEVHSFRFSIPENNKIISDNINNIKKFFKKDTILLGFNSKLIELPFLNFLLTTPKITSTDLLKFYNELSTKDKPTKKEIEKKIVGFFDLRMMCKQKNRLDLFDVGVQLNSPNLPIIYKETIDDLGGPEKVNECSIHIIKDLYLNLFRYSELVSFNNYLAILRREIHFKPSNEYIIEKFTSTPKKKMSDLYLDALHIPSKKVPREVMKLNTDNLIEFINNLQWNNLEVKQKLLDYFSEEFYSHISHSGFRSQDLKETKLLILHFGELELKLGSGGLHSKCFDIFKESNKYTTILDVDIRGYYSWALYHYKLLERTPIFHFFNALYRKRVEYLEEGDKHYAATLKFIMNTISGDLSSKYSPLYDINVRFDLIQLTQILICNWIDFLKQNDCSVYAVNTDGFIICMQKDKSKDVVSKWAKDQGLTISINELRWFSLKSNRVNKLSINNEFSGYGLNYSLDITPQSLFNFSKPSIIKDILEGKLEDIDINAVVPFNIIWKFVFTIKESSYYKIEIQDTHFFGEVNACRYLMGNKDSKSKIIKKSKNLNLDKIEEINNVIIFNSSKTLRFKDLNLEFYKEFAEKEIGVKNFYLINSNKILGSLKENYPLIPKDNLVSIWESNRNYASFIPISHKGYFPKGRLEDNIIESPLEVKSAKALGIYLKQSNLFVIDVDENKNLPENIKEYILTNSELFYICYHSNEDLDIKEVLKEKRFKLLFKSNNEIKYKFSKLVNLFDSIQIEINFTKPFTFHGFHRDGDTQYRTIDTKGLNTLKFPSDDFYYLMLQYSYNIPKDGIFQSSMGNQTIIRNLNILKAKSKMGLFCEKYETKIKKDRTNNTLYIQCHCPNSHLHTKNKQPTDFSIKYFIDSSTLVAGCFHRSCSQENAKLIQKLFGSSNRRN